MGTSDSNPTDEDNDPMKLSEEYRLWKEQYDAELRREGRKVGRKVGQREGRFEVLTQLCEHKLGPGHRPGQRRWGGPSPAARGPWPIASQGAPVALSARA